jgi:zinc protease
MKPVVQSALIALLSAAIFGAATAQAADVKLPAELPPFGTDRPLPKPKIIQSKLDNGMEIWIVPRTGLPRVDFVYVARGAGFAADDKDHPGFANLLAGLLAEGTADHDSRSLAELAQSYGGEISAQASNDGIFLSANAVKSKADQMGMLLAEVVRQASFPELEVALDKANALQGLKTQEATPRFRAERALNRVIFGDHPYGHTSPTVEAISSVTLDFCRAEHSKRFRPDRSLLVIAGPVDANAMSALAKRAFGGWRAAGSASADGLAVTAKAAPVRLLLERAGSVQSAVRLGASGTKADVADYVPLRLTSTILGGGFSSRVNLNLREEKGYTYGASAGARFYRDGGGVVAAADVRNEVTGAAITEFLAEYRAIGKELISDSEMMLQKRYLAGTYMLTNQRQGSVVTTLATNWVLGLPVEIFDGFVPKMQKVTAAEVQAMGQKYFAPDKQSIIVVGDRAQIAEQLKPFGDFTTAEK